MDATTIILSIALVWLLSAYAMLFWVSHENWVEDYHLIGSLVLGPFNFALVAYLMVVHRVWPRVRRFYRRERASIVSKLEIIKWPRLGGR
ncbi:MAG: hypothetical protein EPO10_28830 [Reyranella sp.]|uniref:hypothetical protein n=1 Tax=Reyranella sp. TaxID=1929291 RepID=UPI001218EE6E|nr:hypothetical protein [Reyranella sp.]TAJ97138.1 MAG: hypothetical protein EPO41_03865 [Reyranella sp.]TBR22042.1 MAG: hypothetical protein EPO10_28830 [Reyranella sp.]